MSFLPLLPILTRYPFLRASREVFSDINFEKEIKKFPNVLEEAKEIVLASIDGKKIERSYLESDIICKDCDEPCVKCSAIGNYNNCKFCMKCFSNCSFKLANEIVVKYKTQAKISVLRYIAMRTIASQIEDWARIRFAVSEANFYGEILKKESDEVVRLVASECGIKVKGWNVSVAGYIKASSRIRAPEWRLLNRSLKGGYVESTRREVERIIVEILRLRFSEKVPILFEVPELARKIERKDIKLDLGKVDLDCLPPCMKEILIQLQNGMNVPHTARFAITSFLINIGMKVDEIIELFKKAPDFDEEKTRYQVEHIAGERGKSVEYTAPSCDTMRTYHNCVANCKVSHPLVYYRNCKKQRLISKDANKSQN
ncbi:MAG: DNA primase regulatory subunit PriL [Archaeoglobales archaeon]|nr:DNA primase regulatory subunit PriL [Archaeoglobales archaeon]